MKFRTYRVCSASKMQDDDIQDFDLRWEQALLLTSDPPSDKVLDRLYVYKLDNQEILRGGGQRD